MAAGLRLLAFTLGWGDLATIAGDLEPPCASSRPALRLGNPLGANSALALKAESESHGWPLID